MSVHPGIRVRVRISVRARARVEEWVGDDVGLRGMVKDRVRVHFSSRDVQHRIQTHEPQIGMTLKSGKTSDCWLSFQYVTDMVRVEVWVMV